MRCLNVAVDLDGIVADLHREWIRLYNEEHNHGFSAEDLREYAVHLNVKIGHKIYEYFANPGLYLRLEPLPGAVAALQELHEAGHTVHVISAPSATEQTAADKLSWCKKHLPFLDRKLITLSHQKHLFVSDVFIDDSPSNLQKHAEAQPNAIRMGIAWPYNEVAERYMTLRAESFRDPAKAWAAMMSAIQRAAHA